MLSDLLCVIVSLFSQSIFNDIVAHCPPTPKKPLLYCKKETESLVFDLSVWVKHHLHFTKSLSVTDGHVVCSAQPHQYLAP